MKGSYHRFIPCPLASTAEVTSTVKVPVSSLKSMKYRTIILYLFDTALVVWVKESKVCVCVWVVVVKNQSAWVGGLVGVVGCGLRQLGIDSCTWHMDVVMFSVLCW